jgi:peptidoglycan/LPS O-acetylase OafA/YrhL
MKPDSFLPIVVLIIVVSFAIFILITRMKSAKRGEPSEDELSKKIMQKTAAMSFYISLYMWLAVMYFEERLNLDPDQLLGTGIVSMALIFAVCWLFYKFRGVKNE